MSDSAFDIQKFIDDSVKTLLAPKEYFSKMAVKGGFVEPIIKAAIYGVLAGAISFLWSILGIGRMAGMHSMGIATLFLTPVMAVIGLFIGGAIVLAISAIASGSTDYEASVRVMSAGLIIMVVSALASFLYGISFVLAILVGMVVNLYGLWILYNALVTSLAAQESVVKIVVGVLALLSIIVGLWSLTAVNILSKLS